MRTESLEQASNPGVEDSHSLGKEGIGGLDGSVQIDGSCNNWIQDLSTAGQHKVGWGCMELAVAN